MKLTNEQLALKIIFKDFLTDYNSRNLSKIIGISHVGTFKILKKLEKNRLIISKRIGNALVYSINLNNSIAKKIIDSILAIETSNHLRWIEEFKPLENKVHFAILFGSVLKDEKTAKDIDILVVSDKNNFNEIKKFISERNKLTNKKIHLLFQTVDDFKHDLKDKNKVTIEIIKKGVVLFGQEEFIKILTI